ncbi:shikimate dehydrogenase [Bacillus testis]|uniref:shikimate dehydrogenase n=1 Tax=Bacillus testis TaxID=1622072 RepID=UPI00067F0A6B|nr:shikimate dehydrogenase [Bacillus testis]
MKQLYGVIGNPIAHSMSPDMHNDAFQDQGIDADYHAFHIKQNELREAIQGMKALGVKGFNVTVPFKEAVIAYLDGIDELASKMGAVNTVKLEKGKLIGYNTDGIGYVRGLKEELNAALQNMDILLIGAGGAAKGIFHALIKEGARHIDIANRTVQRIEDFIASGGNVVHTQALTLTEAEENLEKYDLVIQTTSIGLEPNTEAMPISLDRIRPEAFASDIIYNPLKSAFLKEAEKKGCTIQNGLPMFVHQGALAFEIWTGIAPDPDRMKSIVLKKLGG